MILNDKEQIMELTREWQGERFADGRPRVEDVYLEKLRAMTLEEIWLPLYVKGYHFQFEGSMKILQSDKKLIGRAVTCTFVPTRPDLYAVVKETGNRNNWQGMCNQWVVDNLVEGDVLVADMYDKIFNGTFIGGNLTTAIAAQTKQGGAVIWGGIRDLEQMKKIGTQVYYRGIDPTPIRECIMTSYNAPCRIAEVINSAEKTHAKDIFGFVMLEKGIYTTAQIDSSVWSMDMLKAMQEFIEKDERCQKYRNLDWSLEIRAAQGEKEALEEVLKTCLV